MDALRHEGPVGGAMAIVTAVWSVLQAILGCVWWTLASASRGWTKLLILLSKDRPVEALVTLLACAWVLWATGAVPWLLDCAALSVQNGAERKRVFDGAARKGAAAEGRVVALQAHPLRGSLEARGRPLERISAQIRSLMTPSATREVSPSGSLTGAALSSSALGEAASAPSEGVASHPFSPAPTSPREVTSALAKDVHAHPLQNGDGDAYSSWHMNNNAAGAGAKGGVQAGAHRAIELALTKLLRKEPFRSRAADTPPATPVDPRDHPSRSSLSSRGALRRRSLSEPRLVGLLREVTGRRRDRARAHRHRGGDEDSDAASVASESLKSFPIAVAPTRTLDAEEFERLDGAGWAVSAAVRAVGWYLVSPLGTLCTWAKEGLRWLFGYWLAAQGDESPGRPELTQNDVAQMRCDVAELLTEGHALQVKHMLGVVGAEELRAAGQPRALDSHPDALFFFPGLSRPSDAAADGDGADAWQQALQEAEGGADGLTYSLQKRPWSGGINMYKSQVFYPGVSLSTFRRFHLDDSLRTMYDESTVEMHVLPGGRDDPRWGPQLDAAWPEDGWRYMRCRLPPPFSNREYCYARRVFEEAGEGGAARVVAVVKAHPHAALGAVGRRGRSHVVRELATGFVMEAAAGPDGRPGVLMRQVYFEDSGIRAGVVNAVVAKGMWAAVRKHRDALMRFAQMEGAGAAGAAERLRRASDPGEGGGKRWRRRLLLGMFAHQAMQLLKRGQSAGRQSQRLLWGEVLREARGARDLARRAIAGAQARAKQR